MKIKMKNKNMYKTKVPFEHLGVFFDIGTELELIGTFKPISNTLLLFKQPKFDGNGDSCCGTITFDKDSVERINNNKARNKMKHLFKLKHVNTLMLEIGIDYNTYDASVVTVAQEQILIKLKNIPRRIYTFESDEEGENNIYKIIDDIKDSYDKNIRKFIKISIYYPYEPYGISIKETMYHTCDTHINLDY